MAHGRGVCSAMSILENWPYILLGMAVAFGILLLGPLFFGRIFMPRLTLKAFTRWGKFLASWLDKITPGLDLKLMVKAGNRYYKKAYAATPYEDRAFFIPFCLRPKDCPAEVDKKLGLLCDGSCEGCKVGRVRNQALELGYGHVFVVPSSRLMKNMDLLPSSEFMLQKIREIKPKATFGVVCDWHLRNKIMTRFKVGSSGLDAGENVRTVLQGVLLDRMNCKNATVDWKAVERALTLHG